MLENELKEIIENLTKIGAESSVYEFKSAKGGTPKIYDTLSSFSNTKGGIIIFGIDESNNYQINSVDVNKLTKDIQNQCLQMDPVVRPIFTSTNIDGKNVLAIEINELSYSEKPCFYKGKGKARGSYIRVGEADEPMTDYEIYTYEVYKRKIYDENRIFNHIALKDINNILLDAYLAKLVIKKPNLSNLPRNRVMELTGLINNDYPTMSNILLFGISPQMISPMLNVVCVVTALDQYGVSDSSGRRFIDDAAIDGTLVEQLDKTLAFVSRNMKKSDIIGSDGKRHDETEYPIIAIREAILNALIHRDYSQYTQTKPITITMFPNRIEIESPGALYGDSKISDLGKKRLEIRNPTIATTLEILIDSENRHSGIPTMYSEMEKANLLPPKFDNNRDSFKVTFYNIKKSELYKNIKEIDIINYCHKPRKKSELSKRFGFDESHPSFFINNYIVPLIKKGVLRFTLANKPNSKNNRVVSI